MLAPRAARNRRREQDTGRDPYFEGDGPPSGREGGRDGEAVLWSGRGMRIVEALASRWGFHTDGARTVVWADFPAPAAAVERGRARGTPVSGPG
ncbi:hypothetical protein [Actinomadura coerulea]|uniref:hypothetical protein n=1 Tax=Actinomadura coerulea TaxID=46159 RepID=UPI0034374A4C